MVQIRWNNAGFEDIRRSAGVQREVNDAARALASAAGRGFTFSSRQGRKGQTPPWNARRGPGFQGRFRAIVYAETFSAMARQRRNNVLQKALFNMR